MYAAFGRGDLEGILIHLTEDVSWETEAPARLAYGGIRKGTAGAIEYFTALATEYSDSKILSTELLENNDAVAAFGRLQSTVKATGKQVDTPFAQYFGFRDGKVSRFVSIINSGAFLEALEP